MSRILPPSWMGDFSRFPKRRHELPERPFRSELAGRPDQGDELVPVAERVGADRAGGEAPRLLEAEAGETRVAAQKLAEPGDCGGKAEVLRELGDRGDSVAVDDRPVDLLEH